MAIAKIIWIYHDEWLDETDKERLKAEAGEAVVELCTGFRGLKSHKVLYTDNAVNLCDEVHSTDQRLYLWSDNCLRPVSKLKDRDFEIVKELVSEEQRYRGENKN